LGRCLLAAHPGGAIGANPALKLRSSTTKRLSRSYDGVMTTHGNENRMQPRFFYQTFALGTAKENRRAKRRYATVAQQLRNRCLTL